MWIFSRSLGVICYNKWGLSEVHQNYFKDWCLMNSAYVSVFNLFSTQWIMVILSKRCKPDNFEPYNSLKVSFTNIRGLHYNFVECESFHKSNSPDIFALCETKLDDSIYSGNFSVRGYLPLIQKDSIIHMVLQFMWKKDVFFTGLISRKLSLEILTYVFDWLYFTHCHTSFSSINHLLRYYAQFLIQFHLT